MAKIDPFDDVPNVRPNSGWTGRKRGKVLPDPKSTWGMKGGMGQDVDAAEGKNVLNEALGE
jgi:hypothetical protein